MLRRHFLLTAPALAGMHISSADPADPDPDQALLEDHFPSRLHQFVWRNWELANVDRMASVIGAAPEQILRVGASMGLPPKRTLTEDQLKRIYITVIRQNWHLLPESQIIALLGWYEARYRFTLKEDDFLDIKLGRVKPRCEPLYYSEPTPAEVKRCAEIRALLAGWFGQRLNEPGADRFAFVKELSSRPTGSIREPRATPRSTELDLSEGWAVRVAPGSAEAEPAAESLRWFLGERMSAHLANGSRPAKEIVLAIRTPESSIEHGRWTIECRADRIAIEAPEGASLLRAVYDLQGEMERRGGPFVPGGKRQKREVWSPRYAYSYFALYGDPLMEGDAAGLPDAYLERAAMSGITGVWIQAVLNTLAPSAIFPEFGEGWQTRLQTLRGLVARASRYGLKVYLYLNEPRAMRPEFFASRPELRGSPYQDAYAMCTSAAPVRDWIRSSLSHVFGQTPGLGGIFSITMSENHTNCFSHGGAWGDRLPVSPDCPRCSKRTAADTIAELFATFTEGIREHSRTAEIIAYDWGWGTQLADALIPKLPAGTGVLSVSEWAQPVVRGGVKTSVGEYSMSVPGPGPRAKHNWSLAKKRGLPALAKTQFNNTWEISAVPWIPVLPLVLEHCRGLAEAGVDGLMPSWTCGGYPSPNLRGAAPYAFEPRPADDDILRAEAERVYGQAGAADAVSAWKDFSDAFLEFPYGISIYNIPTQHGPANLLRSVPTNLKPGMVLFPHDAYKSWCGAYPPRTVLSQFRKLASKWREGLKKLERAAVLASGPKRKTAALEVAIAKTCHNHFESTANQVEFYLLRDGLENAGREERRLSVARMSEIVRAEMALSRDQYFVARAESLIGYEASNHYYYTPLDLVEKMINCDWTSRKLKCELRGGNRPDASVNARAGFGNHKS